MLPSTGTSNIRSPLFPALVLGDDSSITPPHCRQLFFTELIFFHVVLETRKR